ALSRRSQPESNCVVALIAMHEDRRDGLLAHSDFVLHAAAHPEQGIKSISSFGVLLADNAMSESAGTGFEPAMHAAAGVKRLGELDIGSMEDLDRIAIRIFQLHHFEHVPLRGFFFGPYPKTNFRIT